MKTYYRVKATGQWCGPSYENGGADPDAVAEALGLNAGDVEMIEAVEDPRSGQLVADPNIPQPPEVFIDPEVDALAAILAKRDSDITAGEVKEVTLRVARRLLNRSRL